jgi:tetratricopeptide (TPR) repeat protein
MYELALRSDPGNVRLYTAKGDILLYCLKLPEDALEAYDQLLLIEPENPLGYVARGQALYHLERYEEAIEAYNQALHIRPGDAATSNSRERALRALKRYEEQNKG